jgi:hypothetical protein
VCVSATSALSAEPAGPDAVCAFSCWVSSDRSSSGLEGVVVAGRSFCRSSCYYQRREILRLLVAMGSLHLKDLSSWMSVRAFSVKHTRIPPSYWLSYDDGSNHLVPSCGAYLPVFRFRHRFCSSGRDASCNTGKIRLQRITRSHTAKWISWQGNRDDRAPFCSRDLNKIHSRSELW